MRRPEQWYAHLSNGVAAHLPLGQQPDMTRLFSLRSKAKAIQSLIQNPRPVRMLPFHQRIGSYPWAHLSIIQDFIGESFDESQAIAESWMGGHSDGMSMLEIDGVQVEVGDVLAQDSQFRVIGEQTAGAFGGILPFLFKLLATRQSLSGQVHPNLDQAQAGYAREQAEIAAGRLDPKLAVYKDSNHKPEVIWAITKFHSLYGFRPSGEIQQTFSDYFLTREDLDAATREVIETFNRNPVEENLKAVFEHVLNMGEEDKEGLNAFLWPVVERLKRDNASSAFADTQNGYWVLQDVEDFHLSAENMDPGIFLDLILNVYVVPSGKVLFQEAGVPHFYKRGFGAELMANSNNVARLGLTSKLKDVPGLLSIMEGNPNSYAMGHPTFSEPTWQTGQETYYEFPNVTDFSFATISLGEGDTYLSLPNHEVEVILVAGESAEAQAALTPADGNVTVYSRGESIFVPQGVNYSISTSKGAVLAKATVPPAVRAPPAATELPVDMSVVHPVIMSGGDSTRLFPIDKVLTPLLDATNRGRSLMQQMYDRLTTHPTDGAFLPFNRFFMITASRIADVVRGQLREVPSKNILVDPAKRNTFPAILWVVANIRANFLGSSAAARKATLTVFGADQLVADTAEFRRTVTETARVAQNADSIVAIGIEPSNNPIQWTNYGAIKGPSASRVGEAKIIDQFVEKPKLEAAQAMMAEGGYYWNAGWFTFTIDAIERTMADYQPEMKEIYDEMVCFLEAGDMEEAARQFERFPSKIPSKDDPNDQVDNSMDFAIMEYLGPDTPVLGLVVPGKFRWIDAGNWGDVRHVLTADRESNVRRGTTEVSNTSNSTLVAEEGWTIRAEGLDGIVVAVSAAGNVMITREMNGSKVKPAVNPAREELKKEPGDLTRQIVIKRETIGVTVINDGPGVVAVYGVEDLNITIGENKVVVSCRNIEDSNEAIGSDLPLLSISTPYLLELG